MRVKGNSQGFSFKGIILIMLTLVFLVLTGCGSDSTSTKSDSENNNNTNSDTYEWDFLLHGQLNEGQAIYMQEFADAVKERTDGRLDIILRAPGELPYDSMESVRIVGDRSIEMSDAPIGYVAGDVELSVMPTWPFIASRDLETFRVAMDAVDSYIGEELSEFGVESLFFLEDPPQRFWGTGEPVKTLEDLKGLKIRTFSPDQQVFLKELGAIPVSLSFAEITTALQRGVIDAAITGAIGAYDAKWYELIDWGYTIPFSGSGAFMLANSEALDELPDDIKEIVHEEAEKWEAIGNEEQQEYEDEAIQGLIDNGVEINEFKDEDYDKAQELIKPFYSEWAENDQMKEALEKILDAVE